jgi:hypothetical protein
MHRLTVAIVLVVFALAGAGCGGGDEASGTTDATTTETSTTDTTTDGTATEETTTEDTTTSDTDLSGALADEDCLQLASIGATFAQAITGATDDEAAQAFQNLVDDVPDEIKADVQVLADWFAQYTAKLQDIGIEAGQTPTADQLQQLQAALVATNQQELEAASQRLQTWANENCQATGG